MEITSVRTLWISDIHLGSKDCKAEFLLDFLRHHHAKYIVLVGDIVDFWSMKNRHFWPESHNEVISLLLERAHQGCQLIYVPGNHDEAVRQFVRFDFGKVEVRSHYLHTTACGKKVLALHGDEFDNLVRHGKLTALLGDKGYDLLLFLNRCWYQTRRRFGFSYWSLSTYLKSKVGKAKQAIERFEYAAVSRAVKKNVDGIVCGHIHHPDLKSVEDIWYFNDGDWVENCTALVEQNNGKIQLVRWTETSEVLNQTDAFLTGTDEHKAAQKTIRAA